MKLVFKENEIPFGQDFRWWKGIPQDLVFERIKSTFISDEDIRLQATGYGKEPYGNGSIIVRCKDLIEHLDKVTFVEGNPDQLRYGLLTTDEEDKASQLAEQIVKSTQPHKLNKFTKLVCKLVDEKGK